MAKPVLQAHEFFERFVFEYENESSYPRWTWTKDNRTQTVDDLIRELVATNATISDSRYGNDFEPWDMTALHRSALDCETYRDIHFLRFWLDRIIENYGKSIWNYIYVNERRIGDEKSAEKLAFTKQGEFYARFR